MSKFNDSASAQFQCYFQHLHHLRCVPDAYVTTVGGSTFAWAGGHQAIVKAVGIDESRIVTWSGVMFWDDIRTVDYLLTRPEVDKNRIGCVGLSVGGLRSCHLAALDERIRAAVVVGWMASFPRQLKSKIKNTIGFTKLVPGLYRYLDYPDVASLAMPRPLLVQPPAIR